jgi:hypothetical protein
MEEKTLPLAALIVAVPFDTAVTRQLAFTVATAGSLDWYRVPRLGSVTSWVVAFDNVAMTVN